MSDPDIVLFDAERYGRMPTEVCVDMVAAAMTFVSTWRGAIGRTMEGFASNVGVCDEVLEGTGAADRLAVHLGNLSGVLSVIVMAPTLGEDDLLAAVQADQGSLLLGQMLIFVMLSAMVGTAVLLWPVLRRHSETLALGYVLARTLEVVVIVIGMAIALLLLPLGWSAADGAELAGADVLAETLKNASDWTGYLGAQMVFSISALVLNWAFLRYMLVPRWLAVWGLVGVPLMFLSGLLVMVESLNSSASTLNLLVIPLAVQEMAMAVWLIVKGFDDRTDSEPESGMVGQLTTSS